MSSPHERESRATYPPLGTLKPVDRDIWIVDGPVIRFGLPWPKMSFPTRMTIVRLGEDLFIHSPTTLSPELKREIDGLGHVAWVAGPSRLHYWWIGEWKQAYPQADVYLAPRIQEHAQGRIDFFCRPLARDDGYPWDGALATLCVEGSYLTEVEFFQRESRTLILTDLIENFEAPKLANGFWRWATRFGRVQDPDGQMPRDMRLTYSKPVLRKAVEAMIAWGPERVIVAHGRWYERDGTAELKRAFRWLL